MYIKLKIINLTELLQSRFLRKNILMTREFVERFHQRLRLQQNYPMQYCCCS